MQYLTHLDFNRIKPAFQLRMNFDVETYIPQDSKVRLVCNIVEEMNLEPILSTHHRGRKPVVDPVSMLKILLFCYSEGIYSVRGIEDFCIYDTRAHFLLQGQKAPDHSTINRFRDSLKDHTTEMLAQFVELLIQEGHVDLKSVFIDGTKIESAAGRYTFVWRKSVEKNQKKLAQRVAIELGMPEDSGLQEIIQTAETHFNRIRNTCSKEHVVFVRGIGKRKTQLQRDYEYWDVVLERFQTYQKHLRILGVRNSYSKTDHDATFMRMKEDHMLNGQLKPAYNIQFASSGAFIVGVLSSRKSNDLHTMIPMIEQLRPRFGAYLDKFVMDAGYESVENYAYLKTNGFKAYIKPANYEQSKKKKVREDIGRKENMLYLPEDDAYLCKNGKKLLRMNDTVRKYDSGYKDTIWNYRCNECTGCPLAKECVKSRSGAQPHSKSIKFSPAFEAFRRESYLNITSDEGKVERVNRSIQAEGQFSKLKDGLQYDRFRHYGEKKILSDITLMAIGININKLYSKILNKQEGVIQYRPAA